jgi:SAM-dependent methyltransferase
MERMFPYFKLRKKEDEYAFLSKSKIFREGEKVFSRMYFYLFLYPFLEVRKIKPSNNLSILKFDVWEESSLRTSKIRHLPFLIKKIFDPKEIYFVDIDSELVKMARKNMKFFGFRKAVVINGDIRYLPFKNEKFDIVIDFSTTDHLPFKDLKKTIKEVYRVLKKDGVFLIYSLNSKYFNIKHWNYRYSKRRSVDGEIFPSFPRSINITKKIMQKNGFLILKEGFVFPFYVDTSLFLYLRLLRNHVLNNLPPRLIASFFDYSTLNLFFYIIAIK